MSPEDAVRELDSIPTDDPEAAHGLADRVLLESLPGEVQDAYQRLMNRCPWWASA